MEDQKTEMNTERGEPDVPPPSAGSVKEAAFTNLWVRWIKHAAVDSEVIKQRMLCRDSFLAGWNAANSNHVEQLKDTVNSLWAI